MKKKLLLGLLPTLLVLASCQAAPKVEPKLSLDNIIEDTEAHDEIFGKSELSGNLRIRKAYDGDVNVPEKGNIADPVLGIQTKIVDSKISIRFIAAIQVNDANSNGVIDDEELENTTAVWGRTIFEDTTAGGNAIVKNAPKESTKAYTSIAAPSSPVDDENPDHILTIAEFNAQETGREYTHFVVYTLQNLPLAYANYYINVMVEVDSGGEVAFSNILATTIDQTTQFTFGLADEGYFGVKKTSTGFDTFYKDENDDGNHARFLNIPIAKDESFVLVHRTIDESPSRNDTFNVYGYSKVHSGDSGDNTFSQLGTSQFAKAKYDLMKYHIYLSAGGETPNYIYTNCVKRYYLVPTSTWTNPDANYRFAVYYRVNGMTSWYSMLYESSNYYADLTFPAPGNMDLLIFVKMWGDNPTNEWGGVVRNQTADLTWQPSKNEYTIAQENSSSNDDANWSIHGAAA